MHKFGRDYSVAVMDNTDGIVTERVRRISVITLQRMLTPEYFTGSTEIRCFDALA
jgi:hypothetical protein